AAALTALDLVEEAPDLRERLWANTTQFRAEMTERGFPIIEGTHPIVPIMFGDAALAAAFAERLWLRGVNAVSFSYPVVPQGRARIRTQLSAAHSEDDVAFAVEQFTAIRDELRS
ncbi:MAG: 2-amino-3-ketobutyrate coprotein ligase, partial [Solirubrobacterales bacterium]|nr:2-amino-3-ketobutyrate coprotein ligase [Solirubrobacterales bacterium]